MKRGLKRILSTVLAATLLLSTASIADLGPISNAVTEDAYAASTITESGGWFESAYVEWTAVSGAEGYNAYVKSSTASSYTRLDNELVRTYPGYYRADAVGLKAGTYTMKIVPVVNGVENTSLAMETGSLTVTAYDRSGFAFSSNSKFGTASGAYNDDGTLKSNAKVFYVTKNTAKTITADVITSSSGTTTTYTGLQAIITAKQKGYDTTPFDFRIIGTIDAEDMDSFGSSKEGLQVKGKSDYSEMNITIEGIGEDAAIRGFGILCRYVGNVELRNFAVMNFMEDGISLDTANVNVWIHNLDFFYGQPGSDSDQAKGDGTIDLKVDSQYITISYNHLYDSGKASLCGMTSETGPNYITYHHNWFDHSDSRHPRIRTMSVHIYNNLFDGNSKYGVGASENSNAFVESNYFIDCKYPTLQGGMAHDSDGNGGSNTFKDSPATGVIKYYNNQLTGTYQFTADNKNTISNPAGDAYVVETRDEVIPSTYKTTLGATYNNFDTDSSIDLGVDLADITPVADVPTVVQAYAGRMNGGDFFETTGTSRSDYVGLTSATSSAVDETLKANMLAYTPTLLAVGGSSVAVETPVETTTSNTETPVETTTINTETPVETTTNSSTTEPVLGGTVHNFTTNGKSSTFYTITGNLSTNYGPVIYGDLDLTQSLKMETTTSISFTATDSGKLTLVTCNPSTSINYDGVAYTTDEIDGIVTIDVTAGTHTITKGDVAYLFYMALVYDNAPDDTSLTALEAGTYDATTMISDVSRFVVSGSTSATQVKIDENGFVEFSVNDNATVTVNYKCGSTTAGKTAAIILNGTTGTTLESDSSTADLTVTGLAAGTYKITATQTGGTTAQIISMTVSYGTTITTEPTTETTTVTTTVTTTKETTTESTTQAPVVDYKTITSDVTYGKANFADNEYFKASDSTNVYAHTSEDAIRLKSAGSITFTVAEGATVKINACGANTTDAGRTLTLSGPNTNSVITLGVAGSYAEAVYGENLAAGTYTLKSSNDVNINSITVAFSATPVDLIGDANNDGRVDFADVQMVLDFASGRISAVTNAKAADVSGDGKVTAYDAYLIGKIALGLK